MTELHEMHVEEPYFHLLKNGEKYVELRLNDEKRCKIKVDDKIRFICKNNPDAVLTLSVSKVLESFDFASLIKEIPLSALGVASEQQLLSELRRFYDEESEKHFGTIAFFLERSR